MLLKTGKGAWDCDLRKEILPEEEAIVFEEIATAKEGDFLFEGIPCVQRRQDFDHLAFFFSGCRYRIKASVKETCLSLKKRLFESGLGRGDEMTTGKRRTVDRYDAITLLYSCEIIPEESTLEEFGVPPGCKSLIAIETVLIEAKKPAESDSYWN